MTPLQTTIKQGEFTLTQIARQDNRAIYTQAKGTTITSYEVIRIQTRKAERIMGRDYPEREAYPSNEMWGKEAFTCLTLERAKERLEGLVALA